MNLPSLFVQKRHFFGLSIGKTAIRGVETNEKRQVVSYAEEALPESTLNGGITNADQFVTALQSLLAKGKFSTSYVSVCFPESYAFSREHIFPKIDDSEIHEALTWQVKDIFPFSPKEIYFDWKILKKEAEQTTILVIAVQKKILDDFTESFKRAGLRPISFTPSASVLGPLMPQQENEVSILIEMNKRGSMATIVEHHVSFLTTTASFDAQGADSGIEQTVASVQGLITYYSQKKKLLPEKKAQIFLSGEAANEQVVTALAKHFSYPVQVLQLPNVSPAYHKVYAAAVSAFAPPEDMYSINLLPRTFQDMYNLEERYQQYRTSVIAGFGLLAVSLLILLTCFGVLFLQGNQINQEAEQLELSLQKAGFNRGLVNNANAQSRTIVALFPQKKTPEKALAKLYELVPDETVITAVLFDNKKNQFQISGTASRRENILLFRDRLESEAAFQTIEVPLGSLENPENVNFSMTVTLTKEVK